MYQQLPTTEKESPDRLPQVLAVLFLLVCGSIFYWAISSENKKEQKQEQVLLEKYSVQISIMYAEFAKAPFDGGIAVLDNGTLALVYATEHPKGNPQIRLKGVMEIDFGPFSVGLRRVSKLVRIGEEPEWSSLMRRLVLQKSKKETGENN